MSESKITFTSFLIALVLSCSACQADNTSAQRSNAMPESMLGKWQVSKVLTDQGAGEVTQGLDDKYLIPKYLGRIITVKANRLFINTPNDDPCESPSLTIRKSTAAEIIAKSISGRFPDPSMPTTQDMQLPLASDAPIEALYLSCKDALRAKDRGMSALANLSNVVWFIDLGNNQLAMSWHEQTILILSRVSSNIKPVASFNCAKAGTVTEKAICSDVGLAAYDKSLAQTYRQVLGYYKSKTNTESTVGEFKKSQREWLAQRDVCGNDIQCLEKVINTRIGDLIYDLGDFMYQNR